MFSVLKVQFALDSKKREIAKETWGLYGESSILGFIEAVHQW